MTTTNDPAELARRLDQLSADHVGIFEAIDERAGNGENIDCDEDEQRHQSIGKAAAFGMAASMLREMFAATPSTEPTDRDETRTLEWNGVTVTIGTSSGSDGAALVIIDTEGQPDGSDGWKGLRVDVNDGPVFEGVPLVLDDAPEPVGMARPIIIDGRALLDGVPTVSEPVASARRYESVRPIGCRTGSTDSRSVIVEGHGYRESFCPVHGVQPNPLSPCGAADLIEYHVSSMKEDDTPLADGRYRVRFGSGSEVDQLIFEPVPTFPTDGSMETAP